MADLNAINLEITGTSESAQEAVKSTAAALEGLKAMAAGLSGIKFPTESLQSITAISKAMTGIANAKTALGNAGNGGFAGLNGFADAVRQMADACKDLTANDLKKLQTVANAMNAAATAQTGPGGTADKVSEVAKSVQRQQGSSGKKRNVGEIFGAVGKGVAGFAGKSVQTIGKVGKAFKNSSVFSNDFVRSLARIAKYRILRTILSTITKGATEGMKNLARASSDARATLTQLSSASLTLKNSAGGALYSALASVVGVLTSIINAAVTAMNWINMLFSVIGGRATYMKATAATKEYGDALGGAAGGAKALKQELMGFDEINSLSPSGGGGGGGGGASLDYDSMFEETPVDQSLVEMVEKADFTLLGEKLADKINTSLSGIDWSRIKTGAYKLAMSLATFINGAVSGLDASIVGTSIGELVTAGLTFVNTLTLTVDWKGLGNKLKEAIKNAIKNINATSLGNVLAAKLKIILGVLSGLLPTTYEEWKSITNWVTSAISGAIKSISTSDISGVIAGIIHGAMATITSIGESQTLSNIVSAVLKAITGALETLTPEEVSYAISSVLKETLRIASSMLEFVIDIARISVELNNPVLKGIGVAVFASWIARAVPALGITSMKPGNIITFGASVMCVFDMIGKIGKAFEKAENGEEVTWQDVASIIGSALQAIGLAVLYVSKSAGAIIFGIGIILNIVATITGLDDEATIFDKARSSIESSYELGGAMTLGLNVRVALEDVLGVEHLSDEAYNKIISSYTENDKFGNVAKKTRGAEYRKASDTDKALFSEWGAALNAMEDYRQNYAHLVKLTSEGGVHLGLEQFLSDIGVIANESIVASEATNTLTEAATKFGEVTEGYSNAGLEGVSDVDTTGMENAKTKAEELGTTLKATGDHANELYTQMVEVPSQIVFDLQLNNYDQLMTDLDTLESEVGKTGRLGAFGFKNAFYGFGDWFSTNVADPITDALDISLLTYGRNMMKTFKSGLKSVALPKFKIEWTNSTKYANIMGQQHALTIPMPEIKFYAKGGFPSAGELFLANEAGPEMIGRIGNRTAVANQEQIGDAIFKYMDQHGSGRAMDPNVLAGAIVGALKSAGVGAVYLDGKMLANSINREARRSGKPAINY